MRCWIIYSMDTPSIAGNTGPSRVSRSPAHDIWVAHQQQKHLEVSSRHVPTASAHLLLFTWHGCMQTDEWHWLMYHPQQGLSHVTTYTQTVICPEGLALHCGPVVSISGSAYSEDPQCSMPVSYAAGTLTVSRTGRSCLQMPDWWAALTAQNILPAHGGCITFLSAHGGCIHWM